MSLTTGNYVEHLINQNLNLVRRNEDLYLKVLIQRRELRRLNKAMRLLREGVRIGQGHPQS